MPDPEKTRETTYRFNGGGNDFLIPIPTLVDIHGLNISNHEMTLVMLQVGMLERMDKLITILDNLVGEVAYLEGKL